jgi:hypothetical protein
MTATSVRETAGGAVDSTLDRHHDPLQTEVRAWHCRGVSPDRSLDVYASRQYGVFSRAQARKVGFSDDMMFRRVRSGAWVRLAPEVYAVASAPPKWERQVAAAVLSRPRSLVSGTTAAYLQAFDGFRRGRPEITVPAEANPRSPIARIVRSKWFDELGTIHRAGFRVTNRAETILSLAATVPAQRLEHLVDDGLAAGDFVLDDFEMIRRRIAGGRVRGAGALLPLLDARAPMAWEPAGNQLERHLDRLVDSPGVPPATRQHPFHFDDRKAIVDRFIARWRLVLEADGRRWHTRRADFERDRARDNAAAAASLVVLRFTWQMLTTDFEHCRNLLLATGATRARLI